MKPSVQLTFSFQYLSAVVPQPSSGCQPTGKKSKKRKKLIKIWLSVFNISVQILGIWNKPGITIEVSINL